MNPSTQAERRHLALYLPSLRGGGAERVMVTLANGFAERGHQVDLVLAQVEGPYLDEVSTAVNIVDLKARRVLTSLPKLVRYLHKERPDAMLSALNHANVVAILARKIAKVNTRLVISQHISLSSSITRTSSIKRKLLPLVMKYSYPFAEKTVSVSKGVQDSLIESINLPIQSSLVIYNPFDINKIHKKSKEAFNHSWLDNKTSPVIIAAGRLTSQKDFPTLLHAFANLRKSIDAYLIILGEGKLKDDLKALTAKLKISEYVQLPGFINNPYSWINRADLFVLSSAWEGFGNVLVEAMACGIPVVSTNCPSGPGEILEGGEWGRLVKVGDVEGLALAMEESLKAAEHPDVVRRAQDFSADKTIDQYLYTLGAGS